MVLPLVFVELPVVPPPELVPEAPAVVPEPLVPTMPVVADPVVGAAPPEVAATPLFDPVVSGTKVGRGLEQPIATPQPMMSQPDLVKGASPRGRFRPPTHHRKKKGNAMQARGGRGDRPRSNASRLPDASTEEK